MNVHVNIVRIHPLFSIYLTVLVLVDVNVTTATETEPISKGNPCKYLVYILYLVDLCLGSTSMGITM